MGLFPMEELKEANYAIAATKGQETKYVTLLLSYWRSISQSTTVRLLFSGFIE